MHEEYEEALEGNIDLDKNVKQGVLNKQANKNLILPINTMSSVREVMSELVCNSKGLKFPKGNCKVAKYRLVNKYAPHTASSLLNLKSEFNNSKFDSVEKDSDKMISNLEGKCICMTEFSLNCDITNEDFIVYNVNNLDEEYDVIINCLENSLTSLGFDAFKSDSQHIKSPV